MLCLPNDLVKLATLYWDKRPSELPLTTDEVISALWSASGNVTKAARLLRIDAARLRRILHRIPEVKAHLIEIHEQIIDRAEEIVWEALHDENDAGRRDQMARFVLANTKMGRERGYGAVTVKVAASVADIRLAWSDGAAVA